jgi:hypothetical protein
MFKALLLSACIILGLGIFQNCAPAKQQQVIESSSTGLVSTSSVNVNARCGTSLNSCSAGSFLNIADSSTHSWWRCNGSGSGSSLSCSTTITAAAGPISGVCSASLNNCLQGDLLDVADTSTQFVWNCRGINSGSTVTCSVNRPTNPNAVNGQCGVNTNTCSEGSFFDIPDTTLDYRWECRGFNSGITRSCSQLIVSAPVSGGCSPSSETCISGDFQDLTDTDARFVWRCNGRNGGATNSCELPKPVCTISNNNPNNAAAFVHFGDNYNYSVRATSGVLPSLIKVRISGTRANTNGTGLVPDTGPDTTTDFNVNNVASNYSITRSFNAATDAGIYLRNARVFDAVTSKELCRTTNTTTHNLLPLCTLSTSAPSVNLSQTMVFNAVFPAQGHSELGSPQSTVIWYSTRVASGTTVAVPDEFDNTTMSVSSFPRSVTAGTTNTQFVGSYRRYFVARDSNNRQLCRSNAVVFEITAMPPPAPVPSPGPAPAPAPGPGPAPAPGPDPAPAPGPAPAPEPGPPIDEQPLSGGGGSGGRGGEGLTLPD